MASSLALRILQKPCYRTVLGTSSLRINGFYNGIPARTLASFSAIQKNNKSLALNLTKSSLNLTIRTSASDKPHDHVALWTAERVLSLVLLGAVPAAFIVPSSPMEVFLALSLTIHSHWGIEALVVDYIRPSVFGKVIPKVAIASVYALSAVTLGGLCYFIYTDVGLINAVKLLWKL